MSGVKKIKVKVTIEGEYQSEVENIVNLISGINYGDLVSDGVTRIDVDIDVLGPVHDSK